VVRHRVVSGRVVSHRVVGIKESSKTVVSKSDLGQHIVTAGYLDMLTMGRYNSIFFHSAPAQDSYELLVSYDFLHGGKPFDLATVQLHQTNGRANTLSQDYNMTLPGPGNLTDSVTQVQKSAILGHPLSGWNNMTIKKCLERYQSGTYDQFLNVIVVSNWTAPQNENNSVLDLTILSGYAVQSIKRGRRSRRCARTASSRSTI